MYDCVHLEWVPYAHRIGQAETVGPRLAGRAEQAGQEAGRCPRGVLSTHRNKTETRSGELAQLADLIDGPATGFLQGPKVHGRCRNGEVHGIDAAGRGRVEVLAFRTAPGRQAAAQPQVDDRADRGNLVASHGRRADLDLRDAGFRQQAGDGQFFRPGKRHARRLFAVAKRRVDEPKRVSAFHRTYAINSSSAGEPCSRASRIESTFASSTS